MTDGLPTLRWAILRFTTTDCYLLSLTGLNAFVYTGLNAQSYKGDKMEGMDFSVSTSSMSTALQC